MMNAKSIWGRFTVGEKRVTIAFAIVALLGTGVGVVRHLNPSIGMGTPTFVVTADAELAELSESVASPTGVAPRVPDPVQESPQHERIGAHGLIDLNTATPARLQTLPGVGPVLSERIIVHRTEVGPFRTVDELREVYGIGEKRLQTLAPLVSVGSDGRDDN